MALPAVVLKAKNAIKKGAAAYQASKAVNTTQNNDGQSSANIKKIGSIIGVIILLFMFPFVALFLNFAQQMGLMQITDTANADALSASSTTGGSSYNYNGVVTDAMSKVVEQARANAGAPGYDQYCQKWVSDTWEQATGMTTTRLPSAWDAWQAWQVSTDMDNIPPGANVYASGWPYYSSGISNPYGHVGIYLGNNQVADYSKIWDLEEWINAQYANCNGHYGWLGWGWENGVDLTQQ